MCEDHSAPTRRAILHGGVVIAAAGAVGLPGRPLRRLPLRSSARAVTADGTNAYSMAMHIHSSFSEQNGSMDGQLYQAQLNAVDVCWWTDHDHRMDGIGYRDVTHFTSFSETGGPGQGGAWDWVTQKSGSNTSASGGGIVTNPCSPNDPVAGVPCTWPRRAAVPARRSSAISRTATRRAGITGTTSPASRC